MTANNSTYFLPLGTYRRTLDQKMRITVPGIWREEPIFVNDTSYLAIRQPMRLVLLPHDFAHRILRKKNKGAGKREKEEIRLLLASIHSVVLDGRGRITIPQDFTQGLKLSPGDSVVVTASGGWVEIWPAINWDRGRGVKGLFTQ